MNIIPYIVTTASIIGTVANSFQKRWCFYVWVCTNTFWCIFNAMNGSYAQAALYAFNFIMAVVGLIQWKRKAHPNVRRIVKKVNKALDIKLYEWQIRFIFEDGEYHDQETHGRQNGKTLACALKLCLSSGAPITYSSRTRTFQDTEAHVAAMEDGVTMYRRQFFADETMQIYRKLQAAGGIPLREIIIR